MDAKESFKKHTFFGFVQGGSIIRTMETTHHRAHIDEIIFFEQTVGQGLLDAIYELRQDTQNLFGKSCSADTLEAWIDRENFTDRSFYGCLIICGHNIGMPKDYFASRVLWFTDDVISFFGFELSEQIGGIDPRDFALSARFVLEMNFRKFFSGRRSDQGFFDHLDFDGLERLIEG